MSRFQFVADHLHAFEVKWLCAVVEVARKPLRYKAITGSSDGQLAELTARVRAGPAV